MRFALENGSIAFNRGVNVWVQLEDGTNRQATQAEEAEFYSLQTEYWEGIDREFDGIPEEDID